MRNLKSFAIRVLIAVGAGCLVTVIACIVAWLPMRFMPNFGPKVLSTSHALSDIDQMIHDYRWDANSLPSSLAALRPLYRGDDRLKWDEQSNPLDAWGRPFVYSIDGTDFKLSSYGRDGKPGGIGLDADLVINPAEPREFQLPFHQFIFHKPARGVVVTCLACGVIVFFISIITIDPSTLQNRGAVTIAVKLAVTIIVTLVIASFMTMLHIPNHH